jgi:two-component system sensor histidine kinase HydH
VTPETWLSALSAVVFLAVGVLSVVRSRTAPLAPPLSRMTASLFAYETFEVLKHLTGRVELSYLESGAAALVAPTTIALVVQFLGEWRRLRALIVIGATYFSVVALLCFLALVVPGLRWFPANDWWAIAMLTGILPEFAIVGVLLFRHARRSSAQERARTQVLVLVLALGVGGVTSDLVSIAGAATPRFASLGLIAAGVLIGLLALRFEFIERVSGLVFANALGIACFVVLATSIAVSWVGSSSLLIVVMLAILVAALATLRPILAALSESRARARYLVTLGRFSAQMAHDLKNPLAAIRGAAQFLAEEKARGGSLDDHAAFVELILEQADRLGRVVTDYQRIGRAEVARVPTSIVELCEEIAKAQRAASPDVTIQVSVASEVGSVDVDRDLLAGAIENLAKNAAEAKSRVVEIGAARAGARRVRVWVKDDGAGMDARVRERAFDEFYTTKSTGTGLGLAFVGRVAEAHGGTVRVESELGRGTQVELLLEVGALAPIVSPP